VENGSFNSACVLSGVRNHIFTELNKIRGEFIIGVLDVLVGVSTDLAIHAPSSVAASGTIFRDGGIIGCR